MIIFQFKKIKTFLPGVLFLMLICGCTTPVHQIKRNYPDKLIILPGTIQGRSVKPYVVNGERFYPLPHADGFVQTGKASWYGKKFHGRTTASGEIYNMYKKSAAHKTLPLGTYVRVLNLDNKKQVIVRINDRGPFVKNRIIDLSYAAAKEIDLIGPGVAKVRIEALGRQVDAVKSPIGISPIVEIKDFKTGEFIVQAGAFKNKNNALKLTNRLKVVFQNVEIQVKNESVLGKIYKVRISKITTLTRATEIERKLKTMGFNEAFIASLERL